MGVLFCARDISTLQNGGYFHLVLSLPTGRVILAGAPQGVNEISVGLRTAPLGYPGRVFATHAPRRRMSTRGNPVNGREPYVSPKDIFCLREHRTVNGYRRISLSGHQIQVPNVPLYEAVEVHMVPNIEKQAMELPLWWNQELVHNLSLPMQGFSVHL